MDFNAIDPLTTTAFGLVCFVAGGLVMFLVSVLKRRPPAGRTTIQPIAPALNDHLAATARRWADGRGTPDLAHWAHHRLRTFVTSVQRRPEPRNRSWRDW